ncbi:MAG: MATE family efflux transporter [Clostridia bacterium]|nr:MATE family efflux transporter [Clostridia bacterium]MBQ6327132.1 MATE family efflux transporter [Clostridia bacterium]
MQKANDFTSGGILFPLLRFMLPVFAAMLLQSMYGAVDLMIVGRFAESTDVSAVSTGSQIMMTLTGLVTSFAMGTTILLGRRIGEGNAKAGGRVIGGSICLFGVIAAALTLLIPLSSRALSAVMHAPEEAFGKTVDYIRICGLGFAFIVAYNLIGSVFRGIGDSKTPLLTVAIACVFNVAGDLMLVAVFHMGTSGAAVATVAAQAVSVAISLMLMRRRTLPFSVSKGDLRLDGAVTREVTALGLPIALQDLLVGSSFLVLLAIVNSLGLVASAGVGVAEKVCAFIMLIPLAFMQAMAAFVAQNMGARRYDRAKKALLYAIGVSAALAVVMFIVTFRHGDLLAAVFANDARVIAAAADYLKAYAIDCLLTCFLFCFIGFFNGLGMTRFVMIQGIIGAFCVRIPVAFLMSREVPVSMFHMGLATPCATVIQVIMCLVCFRFAGRIAARADGA